MFVLRHNTIVRKGWNQNMSVDLNHSQLLGEEYKNMKNLKHTHSHPLNKILYIIILSHIPHSYKYTARN